MKLYVGYRLSDRGLDFLMNFLVLSFCNQTDGEIFLKYVHKLYRKIYSYIKRGKEIQERSRVSLEFPQV